MPGTHKKKKKKGPGILVLLGVAFFVAILPNYVLWILSASGQGYRVEDCGFICGFQ